MITDYFNSHKFIFMFGLTALCVAMMIISTVMRDGTGIIRNAAGFVITPVMSAFSTTGGWVAGGFGFVTGMMSMEAENARLRELNEELTLHNSHLEFLAARAAELEQLLNMSQTAYSEFELMGANIVGKEPGIWYGTPIIDAGAGSGVRVNMPVVTDALFGRVIEAGGNHARIRTIIEDTSSVAAVGDRTGDSGFIRGDYTLMLQGLVRLTFDTQNAEFAVGDVIVTSALSSFFPPGLRIGEITEIRLSSSGDRYAIVQPFADFHGARAVLVIMDTFDFVLQ
jgi:rod shape-determining protein MreC